jgi:hypothetical protein
MRKKDEIGNKRRAVDILKRKLLKLGIYSAPIIASVSLPDIKIYAQTPTPTEGNPDIGGAPILRKKNTIEEENNNNRRNRDNKKSRIAEKIRKFRPDPRKNFGDKKWSIIENDEDNDEY